MVPPLNYQEIALRMEVEGIGSNSEHFEMGKMETL